MARPPWGCALCTYEHAGAEAEFLCCALCGTTAAKLKDAAPREHAPSPPPPPPPPPPPSSAAPLQQTTTRVASIFEPRKKKQKREAEGGAAARPLASPAKGRDEEKKKRAVPTSWPIASKRRERFAFVCERGAGGSLRARIVRGAAPAPRAGLARVFEATQPKVTLAAASGAKHECTFALAMDEPPEAGGAPRWAPPRAAYDGARSGGALSLLVSHTQKCVRRGLARLAQRSALELAAVAFGPDNLVGLESLLRRLPIIAVEDVGPSPKRKRIIAPLVWLTLAVKAKGGANAYAARPSDLGFVLRSVAELAQLPDPALPYRRAAPPPENNANSDLPTSTHSLALLVRAAYGGMPGDVAMLQAEAARDDDADEKIDDLLLVEPVDPRTVARLE